MLDVDQTRGAVANATAPGLGTASGALLSAFAVQWLPSPTHLVYLVLAGVLLVQAVGVVLLPETSPRAPGAWSSLVPQLEVPAQTRKPLLAAAPVLFAVWALGGFYASLGPSLIDHLVGSASVIDAGLGLGILTGVGALATYVFRARPADGVMLIGTRALMAGVVVVLLSLWAGSPPLFFLGTAVAGVGFGAGFQGGIRLVAPLAHPDQRAGVLSVLFSISYVGPGRAGRDGRSGRRGGRRTRGHQLRLRPGGHRPGRHRYVQSYPSPPDRIRRHRQQHQEGVVPMTDTRTQLLPGPDHPITVEPWPGHVTVRRGTVVIAETDRALELRESTYPAVYYVPLDDVRPGLLAGQRQSTRGVPTRVRPPTSTSSRRRTPTRCPRPSGTTPTPSKPSVASRTTWPSTPTVSPSSLRQPTEPSIDRPV